MVKSTNHFYRRLRADRRRGSSMSARAEAYPSDPPQTDYTQADAPDLAARRGSVCRPGAGGRHAQSASLICSFTSLGRASTARSKAAMLCSKAKVSEISGLRSTLPEAISAIARSYDVGVAEHGLDPRSPWSTPRRRRRRPARPACRPATTAAARPRHESKIARHAFGRAASIRTRRRRPSLGQRAGPRRRASARVMLTGMTPWITAGDVELRLAGRR